MTNDVVADIQARQRPVILQFNGTAVDSLQTYSNMLRAAAPGDQIAVTVRRGEGILTVSAELKAR